MASHTHISRSGSVFVTQNVRPSGSPMKEVSDKLDSLLQPSPVSTAESAKARGSPSTLAVIDDESDIVSVLRFRLNEKKMSEAVIKQGLASVQASEKVLGCQLEAEKRNREQSERDVERAIKIVEGLEEANHDRGKKEVAKVEEVNKADLKIKDLQLELRHTKNRERKKQREVYESNRQAVEVERFLIAAQLKKTTLQEQNQKWDKRLAKLNEEQRTVGAARYRRCSAAQVKLIDAQEKIRAVMLRIEDAKRKVTESKALIPEREASVAAIEEKELETRVGLEAKIRQEAAVDQKLCRDLADKSRSLAELLSESKKAEAARALLIGQLDSKTRETLELNARLMQIEGRGQTLEGQLNIVEDQVESTAKMLARHKEQKLVMAMRLEQQKNEAHIAEERFEKVHDNSVYFQKEIREIEEQEDRMVIAERQAINKEKELRAQLEKLDIIIDAISGELCGVAEEHEDSGVEIEERCRTAADKLVVERLKLKKVNGVFLATTMQDKDITNYAAHKSHQAHLALAELKSQLLVRMNSMELLTAAVAEDDERLQELTAEYENTTKHAEEVKVVLMAKLRDTHNLNQLLRAKAADEYARGCALERAIVDIEDKLRVLLSKTTAQKSKSQGLAKINTEQQQEFVSAAQRKSNQVKGLGKDLADVQRRIMQLELQIVDESERVALMTTELKDARNCTAKLKEQLDKVMSGEQQHIAQYTRYETHNVKLNAQLDEATEEHAELKMAYDEEANALEIVREQERQKELTNEKLSAEQADIANEILHLQQKLRTQSEAHVAELARVRASLTSLQNDLVQKHDMADELTKMTQHTKVRVADLQTRLSETTTTAAKASTRFSSLLEAEQKATANLRSENADKIRSIANLNAKVLKCNKEIHRATVKEEEMDNSLKIFRSREKTKSQELHITRTQLEECKLVEDEMNETLRLRAEELSVLRLDGRERDKRIEQMQHDCREMKAQGNTLQLENKAKTQAIRFFKVEIEAANDRVLMKESAKDAIETVFLESFEQ